MIRSYLVQQIVSYRLASHELDDTLLKIQNAGGKVINVFPTSIHDRPGSKGEGFTVIYDDAPESIDLKYNNAKPTCEDCNNFGTVNCSETYREPSKNDDVCETFERR